MRQRQGRAPCPPRHAGAIRRDRSAARRWHHPDPADHPVRSARRAQRRRPRRRDRGTLPPRRGLRHPRPRRRHPPRLPRRLAAVRGLVPHARPRTARRRSRHHRHVRGPLRRSGLRRQLDPGASRGDPHRAPARRAVARPAPPPPRHGGGRRHPRRRACGRAARPRPRCPACCA